MLIRCSKCLKEYRLNLERLPQPKLLEGQGEGWWMSCAQCNHQWWQQNLHVFEDTFENFTNLSGLQRSSIESQPEQETVTPKFYKAFDKEKTKISPIQEEITAIATRILKTDSRNVKRVLSYPRIALFLFVAFFISIFGALSFIYKDQLCPVVKDLIFSPSQSLATTTTAPLVLQNVKYGVQPTTDGHLALTVVGEILNDNPSTVTLLPVRIVVWSYCSEENMGGSHAPGSNCVKADWEHPWTRPHILPGERLWFQTGTVLPINTQIVRVDVTLP